MYRDFSTTLGQPKVRSWIFCLNMAYVFKRETYAIPILFLRLNEQILLNVSADRFRGLRWPHGG